MYGLLPNLTHSLTPNSLFSVSRGLVVHYIRLSAFFLGTRLDYISQDPLQPIAVQG